MAIAFDAASTGEGVTQFLTTSHTVTGTNTILFVGQDYTLARSTAGANYNGDAMTLLTEFSVNSTRKIAVYYLINPDTGTHNITTDLDSSAFQRVVAASYTGAKQSGFPDASATNSTASDTTLTTSVTTVADNCWTAGVSWQTNAGTVGAGTTKRVGSTGDLSLFFDANAAKTPPGSVSLIMTSASGEIGMVVFSFAPVPPGPANVKTVDGLGFASISTVDGLAYASIKSIDGLA